MYLIKFDSNLARSMVLCLVSMSLSADKPSIRFGVASGDKALLCVVFSGSELKGGEQIALIDDSGTSQKVLYAKIHSKLSSPCQGLERSNIRGIPYSAKFLQSSPNHSVVGIIAIANPPAFHHEKRSVVASPQYGSSSCYFRSCTSGEGVHLTVWLGEPLKGQRIWHEYYYLGYDTKLTCTEADF